MITIIMITIIFLTKILITIIISMIKIITNREGEVGDDHEKSQ